MIPTPARASLNDVNLDNVNAGDILVGGIEGGAGGSLDVTLFEASFSGLSFDNVFTDDIVIGASGPIPAFASACSTLESKCGTQKDRYQLIDSTGAFEFDI